MTKELRLSAFTFGILPAALLSVSVGQIYAFTLFSSAIAETIHASQQAVQFAFSLGIFFLGMGAAFFGRIVENRISIASKIGTALFLGGLLVTHYAIQFHSLLALYIGYGLLLGLGTGIIYITPVKTMMMWFPKNKALAAAFPIIGFGLGSSLCTVIHDVLIRFQIQPERMFEPLMFIYAVLMGCGCAVLRKPDAWEQNALGCEQTKATDVVKYRSLLKDSYFWRCWLFMLINISAGLCLIPLAKQFMQNAHYEAWVISTILITMGLMNGGGRFVFAYLSDFLSRRINILFIIVLLSILVAVVGIHTALIGLTLVIIPACYGAGFSCIPSIVHDHYGMTNVSTIHGAVLSAWGFAGLIGNQLALLSMSCVGSLLGPILLIIMLHAVNLVNIIYLRKRS